MKVILKQDVKGQGKNGDIVEVSDGYARNYLLPRNLAVAASADNINTLKLKEKKAEAQAAKEKAEALAAAEKLASVTVKLSARSGGADSRLFGAVTSREIADALREQHGISIEKNKIIQGDPIKNFGSYEIKCKLGHEVSGTINLIVTEAK